MCDYDKMKPSHGALTYSYGVFMRKKEEEAGHTQSHQDGSTARTPQRSRPANQEARREATKAAESADCFLLDLQPPEVWEHNCIVRPPHLWCFTWQPAQTNAVSAESMCEKQVTEKDG